ncbi:uncharacterized protein A1O5_06852 [Cladophialophora psammophila CBS 110553]|uniref:FAD-binding PCMH-type domain-containing protein n=1 Tax=Cladophialophora psammophila CBS 110553 TaxID=1182543 RepID=W9WYN7_9EURO|nr:uncharacterized protein A1O5_06852 [Cladophialophora psammophila CBS 110553]EXJ69781.1 hypothetical protein A1O5_06852 [Cladophialophora psammophila CBS 110553]
MEPYLLVAISVLVLTASISSTVKAGQSPLTSPTDQAALRACNILVELFPELVSFPNDRQYRSQQAQYWAFNQADFAPTCRLSPETPEQVSSLVSQLVALGDNVQFAITSGGHSTAHGASNLNDGITLDLSALSSVSVAHDYSYVEVGTGARWLDIYQILDPLGLAVSGGRAASVGIGGYLLGGLSPPEPNEITLLTKLPGSFLAKVILANGTVVNTSSSSHCNLFSVLKGGSNNFGIATRFRLRTFPLQEPLHVALLQYSHGHLSRVISALAVFTQNARLDPSSSAELSVGFDALSSQTVYVLTLTRVNSGSGSNKKDESPLWEPFLEIPTLETTMFRAGMTEVAEMVEMNNPYGFRVYKTTLTVHNDPNLLSKITDLFTANVVHNRTLDTEQHGSDARDPLFRAGMLLQPLTLPHLHYSRRQGARNLMGLDDEAEPLMLLSFESHHLHPTHDANSVATITRILAEAETLARRHGRSSSSSTTTTTTSSSTSALLRTDRTGNGDRDDGALHPFRYINYANTGQDVWALLEKKNKGRMMEEARKVRDAYDPKGVMATRVKGGFKLREE